MSQLKEPTPGKLMASILFKGEGIPQDTAAVGEVLDSMRRQFGAIDVLSLILPFDFTSYYHKEMGAPLWRRLVSFERLAPRTALVEAKLFCIECEQRLADPQGRRTVNIDPGLLSVENLVLATGKNFAHRVYLERGVFADLTLIYRRNRFEPLPWTYPDYASEPIGGLLLEMRNRLLQSLKTTRS